MPIWINSAGCNTSIRNDTSFGRWTFLHILRINQFRAGEKFAILSPVVQHGILMPRGDNWRSTLLVCALLGGVTLAQFWPVCHHDFIVYDDGQYVSENPSVANGLTWPNV